jgi:hypothetical protein
MKFLILSFAVFVSFTLVSCQTSLLRSPAESRAGDKLEYSTVVDLSVEKGKSFLTLMREKIKPALDKYAVEGFVIKNGATVSKVLKNVGQKVSRNALRAADGERNLVRLADRLAGQKTNFYLLPAKLTSIGVSQKNSFGLSTFLALASGGGVAVRIDDKNYFYNVNYGTGKQAKDEMTGRSFGAGPTHDADDVSDKTYLSDLEKYIKSDTDIANLYRVLLRILINCDTTDYDKLSPLGQTVATDFIAVYTAEQDRHLMSNLKSHPWDDALLQVTLLSAFHAGQSKISVMYDGALTDVVNKQATGCDEDEPGQKDASLIDYWQFSKSDDPERCKRSGINVTRKDFSKLGSLISAYQRQNNPGLVSKVEAHFAANNRGRNVFQELSNHLIDLRAARSFNEAAANQLVEDFVEFLMMTKTTSQAATQNIISGQDR